MGGEAYPKTLADHKLSIQHLKERIRFNGKKVKDHEKLMDHGGSKEYNKEHIKGHENDIKEDSKKIKDRLKSIKKANK